MKTRKALLFALIATFLILLSGILLFKKETCPSDLNGDNKTDSLDMIVLKQNYGSSCIDCDKCPGDLNNDGVVNSIDLGIMIGSYGNKCKGFTLR